MKVVLFCGGMGARLKDYSDTVPKPMVPIGNQPVLWHVMKYYAHFGHRDFILCLGYKGEQIKEYFLKYNEYLSNDFVLTNGGADVRLMSRDIHDWNITFADTGISSNIGERLKAVEPYLKGEELFLANYSDGLTDLPLPEYIDAVATRGKVASFLCVKSTQTFHVLSVSDDGAVSGIDPIRDSDVWINGGYFVFRRDIFNYIKPGEDLVADPFHRLIAEKELFAYRYTGFWEAMDTFKDRQLLEDALQKGAAPWQVWKTSRPSSSTIPAIR